MSGWILLASVASLCLIWLLVMWDKEEDYDHKLDITNSLDKKSLKYEHTKPKKVRVKK